ncbi:MAG: SusC/RagA family TonB-linked outer membrane protein, partial [Bacteroidales bacterium]
TGYGVQKKSDLTGAIASVNGEDLTKAPAATFDEALKGRAAGVFSQSRTGRPGAASVIRVRGVSSINGGDPLFVVDGVPMSIEATSSLNPSDIESVEVLKDASSQAIYGASGGNGVILITTKKGQEGKLTTNLDYYFGYQVPGKPVDVLNKEEWFSVYNSLDIPEESRLGWSADTIATLPDVNWQDEVMQTAPMHSVNLSVAGGNEKSTFRISTGYFFQEGIVPNSTYKRFNLRSTSQHKISKMLSIGHNLAVTNEISTGFQDYIYTNAYLSPIVQAIQFHPFVEPYDEDGNWNTSPVSNVVSPFVTIDVTDRTVPSYRVDGDLNLAISPIKGLTYKTILGARIEMGWLRDFTPVYEYDIYENNPETIIQRDSWRNYSWYWQHTLTYDFSVGGHNFTLMGGFESGYYLNEGFSGTRYSLINETRYMQYFDASLDEESKILNDRAGTPQDVANYAYFGRINYDYKGKYLLTANFRNDYSSKFGPDNRSGFFPSVSAGWKFTEEGFMDNVGWLSFGKIRAGWGKIGNSGGALQPYKYYAVVQTENVYSYAIDNTGVTAGANAHGIANTELAWEAMVSSNIGLDLAFFENRLSLTADYFTRKNDGMIIEVPTPDIAGTYQESPGNEGGSTLQAANVGEVKNKGYEITVGFKGNTGAFRHDLNLNFSQVSNEVVDIDSLPIYSGNSYFFQDFTYTAEGEPMGQFYGYQTDGLFGPEDAEMIDGELVVTNQPYRIVGGEREYMQPWAQPGDVRFVDTNGDTTLTADDRVPLGNPHPKFLLGFSYTLTYKIFDFSMFWQGVFGNDVLMITKSWLYNNTGSANWSSDVLDRYTDENTSADLFRLSYLDNNDNDRMSDFYVEPGWYLRMKNIQLGVSIPENIISRVGLSKFRVYFGVRDLITITGYPGTDPEIPAASSNTFNDPLQAGIDVAAYPRPIVYTIGLNATF